VVVLSSWLLGRSLRQSTPWRGASLPSGDRMCLEERQDAGRDRLAQRARCSAFYVMATGTAAPDEYRRHAELRGPDLVVRTPATQRERDVRKAA